MSRYTRAEFVEAGLEPREDCDGAPFNGSPTAPETENSYWFACQYHAGFIDGFEEGTRIAMNSVAPAICGYDNIVEGVTSERVHLLWALNGFKFCPECGTKLRKGDEE